MNNFSRRYKEPLLEHDLSLLIEKRNSAKNPHDSYFYNSMRKILECYAEVSNEVSYELISKFVKYLENNPDILLYKDSNGILQKINFCGSTRLYNSYTMWTNAVFTINVVKDNLYHDIQEESKNDSLISKRVKDNLKDEFFFSFIERPSINPSIV